MSRCHRVPPTRRPRVAYLLPSIPDDLDEVAKNMLALRNACAVEGRCPACGATPVLHPDPSNPRLVHAVFEHEDYCPVIGEAAP